MCEWYFKFICFKMSKRGFEMSATQIPIVVIGSGIAGLYAALKLEEQTCARVLLVTKGALGESNSKYAQGGMVAVMKENKKDSVSSHISDTLKAGAGLCEINTIKFISELSDEVVKDLLKFGVKFDCDKNGNLTYTLEGAHSINRVLHSGGDATGREMTLALVNKVIENPNISVLENTIVTKLLVDEYCKGVELFEANSNKHSIIVSPIVILATGGIGQLYKYTTNPIGATGDGIALAYEAGADLQDLEFVQFHPTALAIDGVENRFLISEAVRGEGAKLVDEDANEFMFKYDNRLELAPRDIVTRAICNEMTSKNLDKVYLNATFIDEKKLAKRFPTISKVCAKYGIDISKDYIPVAPAAHYYMGGVKTDLNAETSIKGLFAIGEVASNGLHGANRLASNSLLECVVCAYKVAEYIKNSKSKQILENFEEVQSENNVRSNDLDVSIIKNEIKNIMWNKVGISRNKKDLQEALTLLEGLEKDNSIEYCSSIAEYELRNMFIVSKLITKSALQREESRGAHYRIDFLQTNENAEHSIINKKIGEDNYVK